MNGARADSPTLVACLTPPGTGAIATLGLRGPQAWNVVRELLHPRSPAHAPLPEIAQPGQFWLGRLGEGRATALADEVVAAVKRMTPVPWIDLHCHGGPEVVRWLLEIFQKHGLHICTWPELERRTSDHLAKAAALTVLAEAPTTRTAGIVLEQWHGAFENAWHAVREALEREDLGRAGQGLRELARYAGLGRHLTVPWRVAILGPPNVGKSSLINALAGYQRSVVSETPGTTRDVVTTVLAIDGWPVEFSDTAGLHDAVAPLEQEGMSRARSAAAAADLCLWLLDAASPPVWPMLSLPSLRLVVNKTDLPAGWDLSLAGDAVRVSARTGAGLGELCEALSRWLVPDPPPAGAAVPFTPVLCRRVEEALEHCQASRLPEARRLLGTAWEAAASPQSPGMD
ncbi:MAG: 50S ribosome-binding GTPase [Planctomycetes bacterium]|nr:50S ribosome-binding GTPase [Planctomycetota bacterium]